MIDVAAASGVLRAYFARPAAGSGPGVILLHDIFGLNAGIRAVADLLADEGYVCCVPDLYGRIAPGTALDYGEATRATALALRERLDLAAALDDIGSALAALRADPAQVGRCGVVGYSLGGRLACRAAARYDFACAVAYYPTGIEADLAVLETLRCPTLLQLGAADDKLPEAVQTALGARAQANAALSIAAWPGAPHGFASPLHPAYDKTVAGLAHSRGLALLRAALGPIYDLSRLWDRHTEYEFATRDVDATMATMVAEPYVNHVPTLTGGVGHDHLKRFYKYHFVNANPPDTRLIPVSRTVGVDRLVDEMVFCFTHTCDIPWMLPGIAPTSRYVEIPLVAIVAFRGDKLCHEHIYWDQASVLVQIGVLDPAGLPVAGIDTAKKLLDETLPSNALMAGWATSAGLPL